MHPKPLVRRTHSPEFKARVLAACRQPGASIAAVALAHGINANVVHKGLAGIGLKRAGLHLPAAVRSTPSPATPMQFVPVGLGASGPERGVSSGTQDSLGSRTSAAGFIRRMSAAVSSRTSPSSSINGACFWVMVFLPLWHWPCES